jgi:hypothetical protein
MIPTNGISAILGTTANIFGGLKPIIFLLFGVLFAFTIIEFLVDLIFKRAEQERAIQYDEVRISERIIGQKILNDMRNIQFLAKKLGFELPKGWQNKVKTQIYKQQFEQLTEQYGIVPIIDITPRLNLVQKLALKIKSKFKRT